MRCDVIERTVLPDFVLGTAAGLLSLGASRLSYFSPPSRPMKDKLSEKRKGATHWTMHQNQRAETDDNSPF